MPAVIVMGDTTDHGGTVIEASGVTDTHGRRISRVGDKVQCPQKGHGLTVIVSGDATFVVDGAAVAYHGCRTSCGATLISSQTVTTVVQGAGAAIHAAGLPEIASLRGGGAAPASSHSPASSKSPDEYDLHFLVQDEKTGQPLPNVPYRLTLENGEEITGLTDEAGLTRTVSSDVPMSAELEVPYYGHSTQPAHAHGEQEACCC